MMLITTLIGAALLAAPVPQDQETGRESARPTLVVDPEEQCAADHEERRRKYEEDVKNGAVVRTGPLGAVACLVDGVVQFREIDPNLQGAEFHEELLSLDAEWKTVKKHDVFPAGTLFMVSMSGRLVLHLGRDMDMDLGAMDEAYIKELREQDGRQFTHVRLVFGDVLVAGSPSVEIDRDGKVVRPINKMVSTRDLTMAAPGTEFEIGWSALDGSFVRDVDTSDLRRITLNYFHRELPVLLASRDTSSSKHPAPVVNALFRTVYPPPSPAFSETEQENDGQVENGFLLFRDDFGVMYRPDCNLCDEPQTPGDGDDGGKKQRPKKRKKGPGGPTGRFN